MGTEEGIWMQVPSLVPVVEEPLMKEFSHVLRATHFISAKSADNRGPKCVVCSRQRVTGHPQGPHQTQALCKRAREAVGKGNLLPPALFSPTPASAVGAQSSTSRPAGSGCWSPHGQAAEVFILQTLPGTGAKLARKKPNACMHGWPGN